METASQRAPLFSNRALLNLGIPIALNSLMAIFMGMADSVMVSSAGAASVSAVFIVDPINNVFVTAFDSIPIGGSVVTPQYIGAHQYKKAKECVRQILYSGVIIATFFMVLLLCLRRQVLNLIYGTIEQAVFQQAVTYLTITSLGFPFLAIGCTTTAMTVIGQCIGAGEKEQARQYAKKLLTVGAGIMVTVFSLVYLFRHQLVGLYQLTPEELEIAAYNTGVLALLTMCSCYFMAFTPVGIFRAAGDMHYPVILACSTMIIFRVGLSYLLCYGSHMGLMGIWLGMSADWVCRTASNTIRFFRGKWLDKKLI